MGKTEGVFCSKCRKARLAPVMYGLPAFSDELDRALDAGELVLGGCMVGPERWGCPNCGTRYITPPGPDGPWGNICWGVPVEIEVTRGRDPEPAVVTVQRNAPWTLGFQLDETGWPEDRYRPTILATGDDLFEAFQGVCRAAAGQGIKLLVNGARRDAHRCQVDAPDTHHLVSLLHLGRPAALSDAVNLLDPAPAEHIGTPDEQDEHLVRWSRSLRPDPGLVPGERINYKE